MMLFLKILGVCVAVFIVLAIAGGNSLTKERTACFGRGIDYYTEIGSFPTLSSGEPTAQKVQEMCKRNPRAFSGS